jgi:DNA replication and repair protein RecF
MEEVVLQINPLFKLLSAELGLGDEVRMIYEESQGFEEEELEEYLKRQFKERREKDIERGVTTFGPHLHDINIKKGFLEARFNTSRGEQRLLSLSLHLSLAFLLKKRGEESLILLDDPFSELDEEKSNLLFSKLTQFNQVIFTSLDNTPFSDKHINTIRLSKR